MKTKPHIRVLQILFLIGCTLMCVYPFWWMMVASLNSPSTIFGSLKLLPTSWLWSNYRTVFTHQPFARQYLNTISVAVIGTLGNVILSSMSGYAFARIRFPGRNGLFLLLLTGLMMPVEVIIIPLYFQMSGMGLNNTLYPLILIGVFGGQGAFSAFMFRQFYVTVPVELEEAACLDGLSKAGTYWHIIWPIGKSVAASAAILAFLNIWNMYLEPLVFINKVEQYTLSLALNNFNDTYGIPQWPIQMAATTISVLPVMIVYLFFQDKVTDAMVSSGVKG